MIKINTIFNLLNILDIFQILLVILHVVIKKILWINIFNVSIMKNKQNKNLCKPFNQ